MARPLSSKLNRLWRALVVRVGTMNATGKALGVTPDTVYHYGIGSRVPSEAVAKKVIALAKKHGVRAPKVSA